MASSDLILRTGANQVTAEQLCDAGALGAKGREHPVGNTTRTPNEKEAQEDLLLNEGPKSGKENDRNRQPQDRQFLELLELQKRMFQST
jgi:hypothetical protein